MTDHQSQRSGNLFLEQFCPFKITGLVSLCSTPPRATFLSGASRKYDNYATTTMIPERKIKINKMSNGLSRRPRRGSRPCCCCKARRRTRLKRSRRLMARLRLNRVREAVGGQEVQRREARKPLATFSRIRVKNFTRDNNTLNGYGSTSGWSYRPASQTYFLR